MRHEGDNPEPEGANANELPAFQCGERVDHVPSLNGSS
jgi:hypothetical protein